MRIALDVMGGDDAPQPNIDGAIAALQADSELEIAMVGDQPLIESLIEKSGYSGDRMQVVAAEGVVLKAAPPKAAAHLEDDPEGGVAPLAVTAHWR